MMICSYADESGDKRIYSLCALLGRLRDFVELGRRWRIALADNHLPEFHASRLENRLPPYEHLERERRDALQRQFISFITTQPIWGFNAFVETDALSRHAPELKRHFPNTDPYLFTFRMAIEIMALEVDDYRVRNEPIAFVFDRQKQHEGKAREIYGHLSTDGRWPLAYRLGSISFASRFDYVELQAADVWAYESRKFVTDGLNQHPERWQMTLFRDAGRFNIDGHAANELSRLIERLDSGDVERPKRY